MKIHLNENKSPCGNHPYTVGFDMILFNYDIIKIRMK